MRKIPILATQTFNSINNTKRLIESINYPVEILSVVINNENFELLKEIKNFCDTLDNKFIDKIDISWHPTNLGCAPSWNYHFKQYPYADFYVKADDDILFNSDDLKDIVSEIESGYDMVFFDNGPTKYACFGITKNTLKTVGLFDENLWPSNYEDDDYNIRLKLLNIKEFVIPRSINHIGCGTSKNLMDHKIEHGKLGEFIVKTEEYFRNKWGDRFPNCYQKPFNSEKNDLTTINYNFDYRENKIFRCNYTK